MWALLDGDGKVTCVADQPDETLTGDSEWVNLPPEMEESLSRPYHSAFLDEHGRLKVIAPPPPPRARVTEPMLQVWEQQRERVIVADKRLGELVAELQERDAVVGGLIQMYVAKQCPDEVAETIAATTTLWHIMEQQRSQLASLTLALQCALQALDATRAQLAAVGQAVCLQDAQEQDAAATTETATTPDNG